MTDETAIDVLNGNAQGMLRSVVERVERLHEDATAIGEDLKEVYAEAKGNGLDPKIIKLVVRWRAKDPAKRMEEEALMELYLTAVGGG